MLEHQLDSVSIIKDSLYEVNFINEVENGRYELSLEHLKEVNPKAAKDFENFLNTQTE
jgi:predicted  nucleic acid-binding Zn-ribbon protein